MRISLSWLSDFVALNDTSPEGLAKLFTSTTAEVEDVLRPEAHLQHCLVVEVRTLRPHPQNRDLQVAEVDAGPAGKFQVVCGAPNVRSGMKCAYAPEGVVLPEGPVEAKDIQGERSSGFLASQQELGVGSDHSGVWELPAAARMGQSVRDILGDEHVVIEFDNKSLTHRPDLWGHLGVGRELAAILRRPFKDLYAESWQSKWQEKLPPHRGPIQVSLDGPSSCVCYYGLSIDNVKVAPSPLWMQRRLIAAGLRPINNLVDIGNYVMLEVGGPVHMFDRSQIRGNKIVVRRLSQPSELPLLDGTTAQLVPGDTVVCDAQGPLVVGGIIGGLSSGIQPDTQSVFIEAANWLPSEIRKLSTRLGVRTDSSARFEKGLDPSRVIITVLRAAELTLEICPGAVVSGSLEYAGPPENAFPLRQIRTSTQRIEAALGREIAENQIVDILTRLGFTVKADRSALLVTVPSFRGTRDFEFDADIAEEVGRIIGYDNIAPKAPAGVISPLAPSTGLRVHRLIRDVMVLHGRSLEVTTYPMIGEDLLNRAEWKRAAQELELANPISRDRDRMRPSLIPSLLDVCALNHKHYSAFRAFEIGRSYFADPKHFSREETHLGCLFCDEKADRTVALLDTIEALFRRLKVPIRFDNGTSGGLIPSEWSGLYPDQVMSLWSGDSEVGVVARIHPMLLRNFKISAHVSIAVVNVTAVEELYLSDPIRYQPLARFPLSEIDLTVLAGRDQSISQVIEVVRSLSLAELQRLSVLSVYELNDHEKSVTLRLTFGSKEGTLSGEELNALSQRVITKLSAAGHPLKQ